MLHSIAPVPEEKAAAGSNGILYCARRELKKHSTTAFISGIGG